MSSPTKPLGKTRITTSLQDRIRQELEDDLRAGRLLPGMSIDEPALCQRFGASRTPVREALLLLVAKGLVAIVPRSGIFVRQLDARELVAMMEALAELEGVLARLAATRITLPLKDQLSRAVQETGQRVLANDPAGYERANAALHDLIYEASGNAFLVDQTRELRLRIAPYRGRLFEKPGRLARSQAEHEAVVMAVQSGDSGAAAEAMREHVLAGGRIFADLVLSAPSSEPVYRRQRSRKQAIHRDRHAERAS